MYVCVPKYGYVHISKSVHRDQGRTSDPVVLELQMAGSHHHGCWEQNWNPLGEQYVLLTTDHFTSSDKTLKIFFACICLCCMCVWVMGAYVYTCVQRAGVNTRCFVQFLFSLVCSGVFRVSVG